MGIADIIWTPPPPQLTLSQGMVHVWRAPLMVAAPWLTQYADCLSADERRRAERFVFDRDRDRFIVGRGGLRYILSQYCPDSPASHQFGYSDRGKPYVQSARLQLTDNAMAALEFNLSHSDDWVVYAIACHPIGIDIEHVRVVEVMALAERFFCPPEWAELQKLTPTLRLRRFFQLWTVKEAYLKAIGTGLIDLAQVGVMWGNPPQVQLWPPADFTAESRAPRQQWQVASGWVTPDCPLAIVMSAATHTVSYWQWPHQ